MKDKPPPQPPWTSLPTEGGDFELTPEALQAHLILGICQALNVTGCALIFPEGEWLVRKELSTTGEWLHQLIPQEGSGLVRRVLNSGETIQIDDPPGEFRSVPDINETGPTNFRPDFDPAADGPIADPHARRQPQIMRSTLCLPLKHHGQIIGALQVWDKRPRGQNSDSALAPDLMARDISFDESDRQILQLLSALAATLLLNLRQVQELRVTQADVQAAQYELVTARRLLQAILEHLPDNLYVIDHQYRLIAISQSRLRLLPGTASPESLLGRLCYQALFNRRTPCPECQALRVMQSGQPTQRCERRRRSKTVAASNAEVHLTAPHSRESTEIAEWEIFAYPIRGINSAEAADQTPTKAGEAAPLVLLLELDRSERRQLESILAQSEKLAALGQLAAGIAHEINNPLTAIIANAQILHRELPANSELQESVELIARAGARAAQMVRNLLDFARKEEYALKLTDLNDTLVRSLELIRHELLAHNARLEFDPDPDLPLILASQDHLQSVWLNLLLNAIDSLDKVPGEIRVVTRRVGNEVMVAVSDNGKGIPADRLSRIFEPFYTTKAPGRGTGLGLSVSHRIVKQHGGRIGVESQVGVGSKFTIYLPLSS